MNSGAPCCAIIHAAAITGGGDDGFEGAAEGGHSGRGGARFNLGKPGGFEAVGIVRTYAESDIKILPQTAGARMNPLA